MIWIIALVVIIAACAIVLYSKKLNKEIKAEFKEIEHRPKEVIKTPDRAQYAFQRTTPKTNEKVKKYGKNRKRNRYRGKRLQEIYIDHEVKKTIVHDF